MTTLRELGELEIVRRLARLLGAAPDGVLGIGDDTAVVRGTDDQDFLLTSDPVVEGTHFLAETDPLRVGHKAVGRVLSDFAAMGGVPAWLLMDLVAPADTDYAWVEGLYVGARELAGRYNVQIVGGDTARGPVRELHVFGLGCVPRGKALLRSGARPGDRIFVTGSLGGSMAGKHLDFEPRVSEGCWLRDAGDVTAMIDVSDGLASDLRHIVEESGVGAELMADVIPVSDAARAAARESGLAHALHDGEDFELLFCVSPDRAESLAAEWRRRFELACTEVGRVTDQKGKIVLIQCEHRLELDADGYEHFRR